MASGNDASAGDCVALQQSGVEVFAYDNGGIEAEPSECLMQALGR